MTLNGVMAVILRYFSEFGYLPGTLRKSSSLDELLFYVFYVFIVCLFLCAAHCAYSVNNNKNCPVGLGDRVSSTQCNSLESLLEVNR